jgi:hypothetical protein
MELFSTRPVGPDPSAAPIHAPAANTKKNPLFLFVAWHTLR